PGADAQLPLLPTRPPHVGPALRASGNETSGYRHTAAMALDQFRAVPGGNAVVRGDRHHPQSCVRDRGAAAGSHPGAAVAGGTGIAVAGGRAETAVAVALA